jgi:RNA polymerase sigma factor (sigma-70 family)
METLRGPAPFAPLISRALDGDSDAWTELVARLRLVVWKALTAYDVEPEEANDAFGSTFLRIYEHLGQLREPEKLPGWAAQIARREMLEILRARRRFGSIVDATVVPATDAESDDVQLDADLRQALLEAFDSLPQLSQQLLRLLMADPPAPYQEISNRLGIPIGAIGPTRQRAIARLRRSHSLDTYIRAQAAV